MNRSYEESQINDFEGESRVSKAVSRDKLQDALAAMSDGNSRNTGKSNKKKGKDDPPV